MLRLVALRTTAARLRLPLSAISRTSPVASRLTARPAIQLQQRHNTTKLHSVNPDWSAPVVTYEQIKPRTEQPSEEVYLIDVRENDEIAQGSIPSAVPLPLSVFAEALRSPDDEFRLKHGFKKPAQDQEFVVYCRSGKRSATAADIAHKYGYTNVKNYEGSWLDWTKREQESRGD